MTRQKNNGGADLAGIAELRARGQKIDVFARAVAHETRRAIEKFPQPNPTVAALTEEVGELAKALLHIREGKSDDWLEVYVEAVQVAAMACRCAIEGDPTIGATPPATCWD